MSIPDLQQSSLTGPASSLGAARTATMAIPNITCNLFQYFSVPHVFQSVPLGFQADTQFPLGIQSVPSGSDRIPSGFRVEIVRSESNQFWVDSDWNLTLFLIKKLIILILLPNIYNKKNSLFLVYYLIYTIY